MHVIAAKAVAFGEALRPEFKLYARQVIDNARALADGLHVGGAEHRLRRHRQPPDGRRPDAQGRHRQGGGDQPRAAPASPAADRPSPSIRVRRRSPPASASARPPAPRAASARPSSARLAQLIGEVVDGLEANRNGQFRRRGEGARGGPGLDGALPDLQLSWGDARPREGHIMRCPFCGHAESQVKDSPPVRGRRRRSAAAARARSAAAASPPSSACSCAS